MFHHGRVAGEVDRGTIDDSALLHAINTGEVGPTAAAAIRTDPKEEAMIRRAFTMRLKPGKLAEYKAHHDNIWSSSWPRSNGRASPR